MEILERCAPGTRAADPLALCRPAGPHQDPPVHVASDLLRHGQTRILGAAVLLTAPSIPKECSPMLRGLTLPGTLSRVLDPFRPCFTAPSFETFTVLVAGLVT